MALLREFPRSLVYVVATVYWGAGMATGPAWNTWAGTIIPARLRPAFFALRSRLGQAAVLGGFLLGGSTLQIASAHDWVLQAFALLFLTASLCRFVSAGFLWRQSEALPLVGDHRTVKLSDLLGRFRRGRDGRLLIYLLSVQTAVQLSGA